MKIAEEMENNSLSHTEKMLNSKKVSLFLKNILIPFERCKILRLRRFAHFGIYFKGGMIFLIGY